jgi:multiple sugar transport system permease protein
MNQRGRSLVLHLVLSMAAVLSVLPLLWMALASLMPTGDASERLVPTTLTTEQYRMLFTRLDLLRYAGNSLLIAGAVTVLSLLFNSMAGYAFAKLRFAGRDRIFSLLLLALVIPGQVAMLPLFLMVKQLGLINTYWGVMIPGLASIFGIFLVRQYALSIPDSLLHAARIDGAGELRIYWSIVLPICRPVLATLALFTFMGTWNDFLWPLIVLADQDLHTLPVALRDHDGRRGPDRCARHPGVSRAAASVHRRYRQRVAKGVIRRTGVASFLPATP